MAEKVNILGDGIVSRAILKQINVLEEMQDRAMNHNDSEAVCALSECIVAAAESYDRHINSDCDISKMAFDEVLYGKSDPVRPPSPKLLQTAIEVYGHLSAFTNIDVLSGDSILERIREAEIEYWKRK